MKIINQLHRRLKAIIVITFTFFFLVNISGYAQDMQIIDSLKHSIAISPDDTNKVIALNQLIKKLIKINLDSAEIISDHALELALKLDYKRGIADSYKMKGDIYVDYDKSYGYGYEDSIALNFYCKSIKVSEEIGYYHGIGASLNNIGFYYYHKQKTDTAIQYWHEALLAKEKTNKKSSIIITLNNLGYTYEETSDYESAIEYCIKASNLQEELNKKKDVSFTYYFIADTYFKWIKTDTVFAVSTTEKYKYAIEFYNKSIQASREINDEDNMVRCYNIIRFIYKELAFFGESIVYTRPSGNR